MMETPGFLVAIYLLAGLLFFFWSEPYRPRSSAAFDACFRHSRAVWLVMILIAASIWPIMVANMTYRFLFLSRKEDEDADR